MSVEQNDATEQSQRLSEPRQREAPQKKSKKPLIGLLILIMIILGTLGTFIFLKNSKTPLDPYNKKISYDLYYPTTLPSGYLYKKDSVRVDSNIIFFSLVKGSSVITISEQAAPSQLQSFKIDGFNSIATPIGSMQAGLTQNVPTGLITTTTTLITIKGDTGISQETVNEIGQNLRKVKD